MAHDVHTYVEKYSDCRRHRRHPTRRRLITLLLTDASLSFVATDILSPSQKTKSRKHSVIVITDRFFKLTWAIPTRKTTVTNVAEMFLDARVLYYGILKRF